MRIEAKEMLKNLTSITATMRVTLLFCVLVLLTAGIATGQQGSGSGAGRGFGTGNGSGSGSSFQQSSGEATTVFRSARDLITDGDWAKAQAKFDEYVSSFPNEKNLDAALYWRAYAEHKLSKYTQCRSTIDQLLQNYPNSSWKDDARVLSTQMPGGSAAAYADLVSTVRAQVTTAPVLEQPMLYTPTI